MHAALAEGPGRISSPPGCQPLETNPKTHQNATGLSRQCVNSVGRQKWLWSGVHITDPWVYIFAVRCCFCRALRLLEALHFLFSAAPFAALSAAALRLALLGAHAERWEHSPTCLQRYPLPLCIAQKISHACVLVFLGLCLPRHPQCSLSYKRTPAYGPSSTHRHMDLQAHTGI